GVPDKPFAVLRVDDEGPGVANEERQRIFEKFAQGAQARRGVGLGLAICRQIATAHGGLVGVTDSSLGGASFFAAFPVAREER
ncbi:MAG: HAMP domain-containing histidine kinase, partial [Myxococcales bacterium]|nr:HAMP domain-containing histidine kinase [Myxococcales bacterium]